MKQKQFNKRLALRKSTLANLDVSEMTLPRGGGTLNPDVCLSEYCTSGTPLCDTTAKCPTEPSLTWCLCTSPPICE